MFFKKKLKNPKDSLKNNLEDNKEKRDSRKPAPEKEAGASDSISVPERKIENWPTTNEQGKLMIDFYETESGFCLEAPIAGIDFKNLDIFIEQGTLIIKGKREKPTSSKETKRYFFQECYWGSFNRKVILPDNLDIKKMKINFEKGILMIKIPKV